MRQTNFVVREDCGVAVRDTVDGVTRADVMQAIFDILKSKPREQYLTHVMTNRWEEDPSLEPRVIPMLGEYHPDDPNILPTRVVPLGTRYYDVTLYTQ